MGRRVKRKRIKRKEVDTKTIAESIVDDVVSTLGIDYLNLERDVIVGILDNILQNILPSSSRYTKDQILHRIQRVKDHINQQIAVYLAENKEHFTNEELEFIVFNGKEAIVGFIPKLYGEALRNNNREIITHLKVLWNNSRLRLPVPCPKCGFFSVTPEFECIMCGHVVSEREFKEIIDFYDMLCEKVDVEGKEWAKKVIERGYVYYIEDEGLTLNFKHSKPCYLINLSRKDVRYIKRLIGEVEPLEKVGTGKPRTILDFVLGDKEDDRGD